MKYITNIIIKNIIFLISLTLFNQNKKQLNYNDSLEYYFSYSICNFLYFNIDYNCSNNIFIDNNFYEDIIGIEKKKNLFVNIKKAKIENILMLIGIMPFLKNNSSILYKINKYEIYKLLKKTFKNKKIKNKIIKFNENDFQYFIEILNDLVYYKWELIPSKLILNNIRYILNNYYNEECLIIFDKSLNLNYKHYFKEKKNVLSFEDINNLLSKLFNYIIYYHRKYWNL